MKKITVHDISYNLYLLRGSVHCQDITKGTADTQYFRRPLKCLCDILVVFPADLISVELKHRCMFCDQIRNARLLRERHRCLSSPHTAVCMEDVRLHPALDLWFIERENASGKSLSVPFHAMLKRTECLFPVYFDIVNDIGRLLLIDNPFSDTFDRIRVTVQDGHLMSSFFQRLCLF